MSWLLAATSKRVREQSMDVTAPDEATLVETDRKSTLVTRWTVLPAGDGRSQVSVRTSRDGAAGGHHGLIRVSRRAPGLRGTMEG